MPTYSSQWAYDNACPLDDKPIKQCIWCLSEMDIDSNDDMCSDECTREYQEGSKNERL